MFLSRTFVFRSGKMSCEALIPGLCALNFSLLVVVGSELKNIWLLSREALTAKLIHVLLWKFFSCFTAVIVAETEVGPL